MSDDEPPVPEAVLTSAKDQLNDEAISLADIALSRPEPTVTSSICVQSPGRWSDSPSSTRRSASERGPHRTSDRVPLSETLERSRPARGVHGHMVREGSNHSRRLLSRNVPHRTLSRLSYRSKTSSQHDRTTVVETILGRLIMRC